ncbi:DUF3102 domain-containing protein [Oscillospiraceae bacterium 50-58]
MSRMSEIDMEREEMEEGRLLSADFGLSAPPAPAEVAPAPPRTVETVTLEIRTLQRQAQQIMLGYAVEIGRRLEEVKAILPHGQWGDYLKNEVDYSQSTANNFMRIYREYGAAQQSLFGGEAKSQAFANLTYTKALRLLAIPDEEEREQFMAEHDVGSMSNRELDKALKEREEALEAAAAAQDEAQGARREADRLREELAGQAQVYNAKLTSAEIEAKQAREAEEKAAAKAQRLQDALSEVNASAQAAEAEHAKMLQELEELRNRPAETDTEAVEAARKAAIEEMTGKVDKAKEAKKKADTARKAAEEALAAAQKELAELKAKGPQVRELTPEEIQAMTADEVEKAQAATTERMQALEKQLAQADPDTATFKVLFTSWQETYGKMMEALERIKVTDSDKAGKLQGAIRAVVEGMT